MTHIYVSNQAVSSTGCSNYYHQVINLFVGLVETCCVSFLCLQIREHLCVEVQSESMNLCVTAVGLCRRRSTCSAVCH